MLHAVGNIIYLFNINQQFLLKTNSCLLIKKKIENKLILFEMQFLPLKE